MVVSTPGRTSPLRRYTSVDDFYRVNATLNKLLEKERTEREKIDRAALNYLQAVKEDYETKIMTLKEELEKVRKESDGVCKKDFQNVKFELRIAQRDIKEQKSRIEYLRDARKEAVDKLSQVETTLAEKEAEIEEWRVKFENLSADVKKLMDDKNTCEETCKTLVKEREDLVALNEKLTSSNEVLRKACATVESQVSEFEQACKVQLDIKVKLTEEKTKMLEKINNLEKELGTMKSKYENQILDMDSKIKSLESTVSEYKTKCKQLEEEIQETQNALEEERQFRVLHEDQLPALLKENDLRKTKGPSFAEKIGYPSKFNLETPNQLFLSMEWILNNLIDKFDDENFDKCEWYDFIWTTFRLIRRKITQFQLDDLDAVHMLEVFTRFHIFSAHNMSEFNSSGFVEHLNFENLGKCLITLSHFYDDFSRRSIRCENESEFRAYFLLYFSRSDTVMDVTRFNPVIRKSSAVQFALKCLSAIDSHNYVNFFKLVQKADFLTSCMLHRYFYEVRKNSFQIITKAFIRSSESLKYKKTELTKLLAFEDEDELNEFCDHIGIEVDEQSIIFTKKNLIEKDIRPNRRISKQLIEYKRKSQPLSNIIDMKKL